MRFRVGSTMEKKWLSRRGQAKNTREKGVGASGEIF